MGATPGNRMNGGLAIAPMMRRVSVRGKRTARTS